MVKTERKKVYLSGPMSGLTFEESVGRRNQIIELAKGIFGSDFKSVIWVSPLRRVEKEGTNKAFLQGTDEVILKDNPNFSPTFKKRMFNRDMFDVFQSDAILVDFEKSKEVSIGSVCEVAGAWTHDVPVFMVLTENDPHDHLFMHEMAHFKYNNFESALRDLHSYLFPEAD